MPKKSKKELTKQIMIEVEGNYYSQSLDVPIEELIGIQDQTFSAGIRSLSEMASYIESFHSENLFHFDTLKKSYPEIVDPELQFVNQLIDNQIINSLIAPDSYSAPHRDIQPRPTFHQGSQEAIEIRKNCERPFNLMKKREGFEQTRVRSQHAVVVRSALTTIVTLLLEMAGTRQKPQKKYNKQRELFAATG